MNRPRTGVVVRVAFAIMTSLTLVHAAGTYYFYDPINRLVKVELPDGIVVTYTYDALGNRLTKSVIHDMDFDGSADALDNCRAVYNPGQANSDADILGDACDCAPTDPGAFAIPAEVSDLTFAADGVTLSWTSAATNSGSSTIHEVFRGSLLEMPVGSQPSESCVATQIHGNTVLQGTIPSAGSGFWYLVRARNSCGLGTLGTASNGSPRVVTAICPECGDGIKNGTEVCDGSDLGGDTCQSQGFDLGALACSSTCSSFVTSGCSFFTCGDGIKNGTEVCDGSDLGGETCQSQGWDSGILTCYSNCLGFDTSGCLF